MAAVACAIVALGFPVSIGCGAHTLPRAASRQSSTTRQTDRREELDDQGKQVGGNGGFALPIAAQ